MEQLTTATLTQLPQVRALGRHAGRDPLTLFWTASGMELEFTGSELWVDLFADYEAVEPWVSVELNGAWVARFAVNPGKSRICLFRGMTPGKAKHLRLLKDVQAMHDDPAHLLQITGLEYAGGEFLPLPEPQYRLEFVGDSITSGEGAIGAKPEEDWVGAFFSAENHYGRLTADALGAEYRCISQSGWGIVTGWDNDVRHVMPPYYTQVCGVAMGQRNAAPDGRCAAERFPVADRIVVGIAVGDNADALLQLDQNAERVGRVIDLCIEQHALGVHQFADLHRQTSRPSALPIRLYRYSPTAPSAQVQVVTWSAAALTSAGALATATA